MEKEERHPEYQYLDLAQDILDNGFTKPSLGGGVELKGVFGRQHRWDLSDGTIPIITTKQVAHRTAFREMLWFISGDSNIKTLVDQNIHIWDEWPYRTYLKQNNMEVNDKSEGWKEGLKEFADRIKNEPGFAEEYGDLGPVYGAQWRRWRAYDIEHQYKNGKVKAIPRDIDQLAWAIDKMKRTPTRKHDVVTAWNPEFIYEMARPGSKMMEIPPCHMIFQLDAEDDKLSMLMLQRSADTFLGVPFNIAQYAMLLRILAHVTNMRPGDLVHTFGNVHIYENSFDQIKEQLTREPYPFPTLTINPDVRDIDKLKIEDFKVEGYQHHPPIKGEVVVVGGMF